MILDFIDHGANVRKTAFYYVGVTFLWGGSFMSSRSRRQWFCSFGWRLCWRGSGTRCWCWCTCGRCCWGCLSSCFTRRFHGRFVELCTDRSNGPARPARCRRNDLHLIKSLLALIEKQTRLREVSFHLQVNRGTKNQKVIWNFFVWLGHTWATTKAEILLILPNYCHQTKRSTCNCTSSYLFCFSYRTLFTTWSAKAKRKSEIKLKHNFVTNLRALIELEC